LDPQGLRTIHPSDRIRSEGRREACLFTECACPSAQIPTRRRRSLEICRQTKTHSKNRRHNQFLKRLLKKQKRKNLLASTSKRSRLKTGERTKLRPQTSTREE